MKIKNITIVSSKGKAQTMSLKEAKELYESLDEIFGSKALFNPPVIIERHIDRSPYPQWPQIWCSDSTSPLSLLSETAGEG